MMAADSLASFILLELIVHLVESRAIIKTNQMRYATDEAGSSSLPLAHMLELASPSSKQAIFRPYNRDQKRENEKFHEGKFLDDEDKRLLDEFYRETKKSDPFLSDGLSIESLWDEEEKRTRAGAKIGAIDGSSTTAMSNNFGGEKSNSNEWSYDESIIDGLNGKPYEYNLGPTASDTMHRANYSPAVELLTTFSPNQTNLGADSQQADLLKTSNQIVGATLFGRDQHLRPSVSSKSASEAIKLHNDLLLKPPNDGKVRVRMYYHRAIHDDAKLYGSGPWKYWGHGWGLEYGYDPRQNGRDFYQRGYTIERAFGRDFCKDNKNCRKSDPNFFRDPKTVGKYSEQYFRGIKRKDMASNN